jgi:hypothetical protein
MKFTRENLHQKGYRPDGRGGLIRLPEDQWRERHVEATAPAPAIRVPRSRLPNATEHRWFLSAKSRWPGLDIRYEAISFRLNSGARYTPDFSGWDHGRLLWCCEVKGAFLGHSARSILAWKEVAANWPAVTWIFAQFKSGRWIEAEVGGEKSDAPRYATRDATRNARKR